MLAGRISALQFQAVRLACQKHETFLPDGSRAGFFLGDGKSVEQLSSLLRRNIVLKLGTVTKASQWAVISSQIYHYSQVLSVVTTASRI